MANLDKPSSLLRLLTHRISLANRFIAAPCMPGVAGNQIGRCVCTVTIAVSFFVISSFFIILCSEGSVPLRGEGLFG